ncbi:glycosyltransferase, partial [Candidatus Saccharibacteria bacterium]|nr:glycosyltransferase [Candidatus Saccharibacteria bacterium]
MKTKNRPRPLLSIITRTYQRPDLLERCINSVLRQTLPDFEHLIIDDSIGHGLYWANRQIAECAEKTNGFYIYVLDDDDFITSYSFLEDLKDLLRDIAPREPDLIVCCGQ